APVLAVQAVSARRSGAAGSRWFWLLLIDREKDPVTAVTGPLQNLPAFGTPVARSSVRLASRRGRLEGLDAPGTLHDAPAPPVAPPASDFFVAVAMAKPPL